METEARQILGSSLVILVSVSLTAYFQEDGPDEEGSEDMELLTPDVSKTSLNDETLSVDSVSETHLAQLAMTECSPSGEWLD